MPITIGSNIASLRAQRQLGNVTESMGRTFERLSSGMRINRASDDAAGLAISDSLRTDSRLYGVAIRNISDGVSALNIVDGALSQQVEIVSRLQELATQSANGAFSYKQRKALQTEFNALSEEYFRIAETTSFNGRQLLQSQGGSLDIQSGITGTEQSLKTLLPSILRATGVFDVSTYGSVSRNQDVYTSIQSFFDRTAFSQSELEESWAGHILYTKGTDDLGNSRDVAVLIGSSFEPGTIFMKAMTRSLTNPDMWEGEWNVLDYFEYSGGSSISLNSDGTFSGVGGNVSGDSTTGITFSVTTSDASSLSVDLSGIKFKNSATGIGTGLNAAGPIDALRISTGSTPIAQRLSRDTIDSLSNLITEINLTRGIIGAGLSRLSVAGNNIHSMRQNYLSAESRIRDVDIAEESSQLVRTRILQQMGVAVLAQANQQPSLALTLLRS